MWLSSDCLVIVATPDVESDGQADSPLGDILVFVHLSWPSFDPEDIPVGLQPTVTRTAELACSSVCCCCGMSDGRAVLQTNKGQLILVTLGGAQSGQPYILQEIGRFPKPCDTLIVPPALV